MKKPYRGRLLISTCLTGAALGLSPGAAAQTGDATWKPRADVEAEAGERGSQVSVELFAPLAQSDSSLLFITGRAGTDEKHDRNGSVTVGARGRIGDGVAIGVNAGLDFYRSSLASRSQTTASFGLEGFTSVFDVRLNYRMPLNSKRVFQYQDPNAAPLGVLSVTNNRLIETKSGFRIDEVPLSGFNGEIGARASLSKNFSVRASAGAFDYRDDAAARGYRGIRGGIYLELDNPVGEGSRFSLGARLDDDNRFGTHARAMARLSIPFGGGSRSDRSTSSGLDRQMGDRIRRDYVAESGSRYSDLTTTSFAIDDRTGAAFGGIYYTNGTAVAGAAGTAANPTAIGDAVTRAGANGVVVALGNAGNITTGGVTLATNQYLLGGASSVAVRRGTGAVTQFSFGGTNGTIVGTSAAGATVTLGQGSVVRDVTIRGAGTGIAANGVGGFSLDRLVIENTGGVGLSLTNTLGAVVVDGITIRGGGGAGVLVNGGSNITLRNSTIGGGAGAIDINDGGAALSTTLSNLTLSATGGNVLDIDGSGAGTVTVAGLSGITIAGGTGETGGFAARSVDFDSSAAAGVQAVNAGRMEVGTNAARVNGAGVTLTDVTGALSFANLDISNNAGTGLTVANSKVNGFALTTLDGTVDTTAGTALNLDPLILDLTFASVSSLNAPGAGIILDEVTGAGGGSALTIGTLTITNAAAQGLFITGGSTGLVRINGGSISNSGGASVQIGQAGVAGSGGMIGLNFGASISDSGAGPLISLYNVGGSINFTGTIAGAGPILVNGSTAGSSISFTGATTLTGSASPAVSIQNLLGSFNFGGALTIVNPAGDGIVLGTVTGGVTFGDVDITGLGGGTGLDLTGAQGNVTFRSLDITGTGFAGSTGIDLTGATNAGTMVITDPSTIQGVDIGVDLTNASITGTFRFGDGNSGDGLESTITANTPIVTTGLDSSHGTYDFSDVFLNGNTNNITGGSFTAYYVQPGALGDGSSSSNPGTLAGAEASGAQYIVLLNNPAGGTDVLDAATAGGSLDLIAGQTLVSFLYTDFFAVTGATVPSNLIVSGLGPTGILNPYTGSGAATLTTSTVGMATVNLSSGSRLDGLVIQNGGTGVGVSGNAVTSTTIVNSNISGNGGGVRITDGGAATTATLDNLNLGASGGTVLSLSGAGAGTLSVSGSGINIAATGTAGALNLTDVAAGNLSLATITAGASLGNSVSISAVTGSLTTGNIAVGATIGGDGVLISGNSGTITTGNVTTSGTGGAGLSLVGNSGTVTVGTVTVADAGGYGVNITNTTGAVTLGATNITGSTLGGINLQGVTTGHSFTVGPVSVTGAGGVAISVGDVDGAATFGATTIASRAGILLGAGTSGSITFGDVDITGLTANTTGVDARSAAGSVTFNTLDIAGASTNGTRGVDLRGATFAGSVSTTQSGTITGVDIGVDLTGAAITGNFRYGDGSNVDSDGAASFINAVTPIAVGGINAGVGTYDFRDVNLTGDTSGLASSASLFWVKAGASGAGTRSDPGSIGAAEASGANIIILINDPAGGNDTIDAGDPVLGAGGTFAMIAGQQLLGFLNGDTLTVPGGAPANVLVYGITPGLLVNPFTGSGAPTLTTTGGAVNTVTVANNVVLDGLIIANPGGTGVGGVGASNVTIRNSRISGADSAIGLSAGTAAASTALSNLLLWSSGNSVALAANDSTAGTMTVTQLSNITIEGGHGEGAATDFFNTIFDADLATAGAQTVNASIAIGTAATRTNGYALGINGASGALNFTALSVYNTGSSGLVGTTPALRLSASGGTIDTLDGNTINLASASLDLALDRVAHSGTGFAIGLNGITGVGTGGRALDVTNLAVTGGSNAFFVNGASTGNFSFGAASSISGLTGDAIILSNTTGALNFTYNGSVTTTAARLLNATNHNGTVTFGASSNLSATGGAGLLFNNADGTYNFTGNTTLNGGDAGIDIANGSAGTFTFGAGTSITSPTGTAIDVVDSTANLTYAGSITQASNSNVLSAINHSGGTLTFTGTINATNGAGLLFNNADGTYNFAGNTTLNGGDAGVDITNGSAGTFTFGANTSITSPAGNAFDVRDSSAAITYSGSVRQANNAALINIQNATGTANFGSATLAATGGTGLLFNNADGTYQFGSLALSGGARIAIANGSSGAFSFGDVDITGLAANTTAVDLRGATGNVTFNTLDISGASASGTRGIDLTGSTTASNIIVSDSSMITGVGIGVDLTNAAITGTFRYGDGSNTDADGAASTINATIPLVVTGLNAGTGTYDFRDVNLVGDTSGLASDATLYWVREGASGAGTRSDPGSIGGAEASGANIIILLNDPTGGNDTIDANNPTLGAGGTFDMVAGQQLLGFLNGDTLNVPGGAPANLLLYGLTPGVVTNPFAGSGAPTLTTSAGGGASTVVVANNVVIDGVIVANGGTGTGVVGVDAANVTIRNSRLSGANSAIDLSANGGAASVALSNLLLWANNGSITLATYVTGVGSMTVTQLSDVTIEGGHGEQGATYFAGATFDSDIATAGNQTVNASLHIGSASARVNGVGLNLNNASGAVSFSDLTIYNSGGMGLDSDTIDLTITAGTVDTVNGNALQLLSPNIDVTLNSVTHAGTGIGVLVSNVNGVGTGGRALDIANLSVTGGTNGILFTGASIGTFTFGAASSISGTTGDAVRFNGAGAIDFTYNGSVSQANNAALVSLVANNTGTLTFSGTSSLTATNGTGLQFSNADGTYNFNGTTTLNGGDAGVDIIGGSDGTFNFGAGTSITSPTGAAINIANSTANVTYSGSVAQANNAALLSMSGHSVGTLTFNTGTLSATNGTGLQFNNADGTYNFNGTTTLNGGDAGIDITGGSDGTFTFGAGTSITSPTGAAIAIDGSAALVAYAGSVTQANNAALLSVTSSSGVFRLTGSASATNGTGLQFDNADGSYEFTGTTTLNGGDAGVDILNGSGGTFTFGAGTTITSPTGAAITLANSTAGLTYSGSITQANNAALLDVTNHNGGQVTFNTGTVSATNGTGLQFSNADSIYTLGDVALSGGARLAILGGSAGSFTFGNVDITGLAASTTAVDLTGATGDVTFATLDITGASLTGTTGIDATGITATNVTVNESSNISGVAVGINLTNAAITGTFRYGDGSNVDLDGAASNITATTPLVIAGLNGGIGTYNFSDVNLNGDTSNLSVSAYFVLAGASGTGTRSDPGSLAGAEAASATYIVLLNNPAGGNDTLDATSAGGSLDLDGGQFLYSFRNTDSFNVGGGAPANVFLYNVQTGIIDNPFAGSGAPTLTASGTAATVTLNGSNIIDGVIIANSGTGAGILGDGVTNVTIRNSTIGGGAAGAINILDNTATTVLSLNNLTLSAAGGNILNLAGTGAGSLTIRDFAGLTALHTTETGGYIFNDVTFDGDAAGGIQAVNAGAMTIGTPATRITGDALSLTNAAGSLTFTDIDIANDSGTGLLVANSKANGFLLTTLDGSVDTTNGTAVNLDPLVINMVLSTVKSTNSSEGILLDTVDGSFTVTGAIDFTNAQTGLSVVNNTGLAVDIQGALTITGSSLRGVYFNNNYGSTANFSGGMNITTAAGNGFESGGIGGLTVTGTNIINSAGNGVYLGEVTVGGAGVTFDSITSGTGSALFLDVVNLTGAVNVGGIVSNSVLNGATFSAITGTGGVNLTGTLDFNGAGLRFIGTLGTINIANVAGSTLTIDGATTALHFDGVTSGAANIASAAGTASIGATTSSTTRAIYALSDAGGTLSYGGTIRATSGYVLSVDGGSVAAINLSGAVTSTTATTAFDFIDADGVYNISGSISHTGGTGVVLNSTSSGNATFSNASKAFSVTGGGNAVAMNGTGTLTLSGGGLDLDATSGTGLSGTAGTLIVTGAGNSITGINGDIVNLNGVTAGAGGINFDSLTLTGTGNRTSITLNNLDGTSFSGGTVSIAGTNSATRDGIFIGGGSAATIGFGATTIAATGGDGIEINGAGNGAITFSSVTINNTGGAGVNILNSDGTVTISGGAIGGTDDPTGAGMLVDGGSGAITINAAVTKTTAGTVASVINRAGGSVSFGGALSVTGAADGINVANNTGGTVAFTGAVTVNSVNAFGVFLDANAGSTINFTGGVNVANASSGFVAQGGGTVTVTGTNALTATGVVALHLNGITVGAAGISFGSVTKTGGTNGVRLTNVAPSGGAIALGTVNLQNVTTRGVDVNGMLGAALTINDLDVSLNNASAVAFDLNGATVNAPITIADFDVTSTSASSTIGIDLRGATGGQTVRIGDSIAGGATSTIAGVATGVYLNGTTNLNFIYGDGEAGTDATSSISAVTAINASAAPAAGTYDFRDVTFSGSPGSGFGIGSIYFVDSTGGGNGTGADGVNPMTLAAAELAALGSTDIIVLINNGSAISAAGSNGNDTLLLNSGVQVRGFGQGPVALTLTVPSTILLSSGTTLNIADPTGNGAATLTSAAGADVITLGAMNNRISGFILDGGPAGALRGINDSGAGGSATLINFMTIRNFTQGSSYGVEITPSTNTTIDNVSFSGNTNDLLVNDAAGTTLSNITSTGATGTSLTINNASGTTALTNVNVVGGANGIVFNNATGTINAVNVDVTGGTVAGLLINGGTANFNFDAASSIIHATTGAAISFAGNHTSGTFAYAGTVNATNGTGLQFDNADGVYNFTGTSTLNGGDAGVDILNGSSGIFTFGAGTSITNPSGTAFNVNAAAATITYNGAITANNGYAVNVAGYTTGTMTFGGAIGASNGTARGINIGTSTSPIVFNGEVQLNTHGNDAITIAGISGTNVSFTGGGNGVDIATDGGRGLVFTGGGTLDISGSGNSISTNSGTAIDVSTSLGAVFNASFANVSTSAATTGISIVRTASTLSGTVNITGGSIIAGVTGINLNGDATDFTYGGTINAFGGFGSARAVSVNGHTANNVTFSGNITNTSNNGGISAINNTGGTISFTGQSIAVTNQSGTAVSLTNNTGATIRFAPLAGGDGLDIINDNGTGMVATGGGTLIVTGADNSITTQGSQLINFDSISAGTGGINFASLFKQTSNGGAALRFNNLDGTSFTANSVSVGASGGGDTSLSIGGGSAATFNFGGYTSNNSSSAAIRVTGPGNGTVTFGSVSISGVNSGDAIVVTNSDNNVTINGGSISGINFGRGIYVSGGSGNVSIAASVNTSSTGNKAVEVSGYTSGTLNFSGNITASGGFDNGIAIGTSGGTINFTGQSINLSTGAFNGISITGAVTGAAYNFTPLAGGTGLDIATTTGTGMILTGSGAATYTVGGSGNSITTGSGTILNITNASANTMTLGMVFGSASNTSGANGILADRSGAGAITGTLNISGGAITATTRGVDLNGETLNFTYGGSITTSGGAARSIEVTGHSAGTATFSGAIADTSQGINLSNNTGGTIEISGTINAIGSGATAGLTASNNSGGAVINFSGATKRFNTGTTTAVTLATNTGATINFTGGGLALTSTSGGGLNVTGGGTINVTGSVSTITSTTGTALNVANTTIGASNLTFQSIASNGATNGIILNNTGTSGGLRVTGTGSAGSGGTIQNSTGDGISLTSTEDVRLSYMNVINNLGDGIGGSGVNGFVLNNMTITGNGNDAGTDESGINITNLSGGSSVSARPTGIFNSTISNNNEFEVQINNSTGTLTNFQLVGTTIASNGVGINGNGTSPHGNLFNFLGTGTSTMGISVSGGSFTGNWNATTPPATITGSGLFADSSGASMTVQVSGATFTNNNNGINVSTGPGSTTLTYSIDGNTFTGTRSTAINDFQNGNAPFTRTVNGRITNNIIGNNAVTNSGSNVGNGISIANEGGVNANYLISGNTIQQIQTTQGIVVNVGLVGQATGNGTTNVTILNNTIRNINGSRAIAINNNQNTGGFPTVNVSMSGNGFSGIAGQAGNGQYLRFSASGGGTINIAQAQATASAIANELDDANGFNDTTKISIGTGTFNWGQPTPTQPPAFTPLP